MCLQNYVTAVIWIAVTGVATVQSYSEANQTVHQIPLTLKRDPWLIPNEGVLVSQYTPVYMVSRENDGISFWEIPELMSRVATEMLPREEYQKANVENMKNDNPFQGRPTVLYPEIMVVVTYDLYEKLGLNIWTVVPYLLAFWNGVDILYRGIESPKIRLNIAGIIIESEPGLLEYTVSPPEYEGALKVDMFYEASEFWYKQKNQMPLDRYDEIVTMTTRDICTYFDKETSECLGSAIGQALTSGVCQDSHDHKLTFKVAFIVDNGKFGGILTAAHELGHSLGILHDNTLFKTEEDMEGLPSCNSSDTKGFIMFWAASSTGYEYRWSQCSLEQLEKTVKDGDISCLKNTPPFANYPIPRLLPGQLTTAHEQCVAYGYKKSCHDGSLSVCQNLQCESDDEHHSCSIFGSDAAIEGTPCDDADPSKFCMFGRCINKKDFT